MSMKTIQFGQVEGVKNTIDPVRKKKNFDKKITARTEAHILGTTGMGHYDNEGLSGRTLGKGKGKKGTGKGFGKQFQGLCNTCGTWGDKAIDCKSHGKASKAKTKPQGRALAGFSPTIIPMNRRNSIDIEPGNHSLSFRTKF